MSQKKLKIEYLPAKDLVPCPQNPRKNDEAVSSLVSSMEAFGWTNPILVRRDNNMVIAGHTRLKAAIERGVDEVPVIYLDLDETDAKTYMLADNKLTEMAEWDGLKLAEMFAELDQLNVDLDLTGFNAEEIADYVIGPTDMPGLTDDDAVPDDAPTICQTGDLWQLGEHRLLCGDATKAEDVERLMDGEKADMVFTDPPYLMDFSGGIHADGTKSFNASHGKLKNDKMSEGDGDAFIDEINANVLLFCKGAFYITFYRLGIGRYFESLKRVGLQCRSLIIWEKGNHTLSNSDYMSRYEPIFYGWVESHNFYGGNNGVDVWNINRTKKNELHPTMKPVELCVRAILDASRKSESVLDLFLGSGTTIIACEKTNRRCYGMEIDPHYCDVIIKRWEDYTGKKAVISC